MSVSQQIHVIIPAGGIGSRMGLPYPKQLMPFRGTTLIQYTVSLFGGYSVTVAVPAEHRPAFETVLGEVTLVDGGETRFESVRNAFRKLNGQAGDLVVIHDAARPYFDPKTLDEACDRALEVGAVIYTHGAVDTMKWVGEDGQIQRTLDRRRVFHAQTPQIFRYELLEQAYDSLTCENMETLTDEAALFEAQGRPVFIFSASSGNRKLTHPEDLEMSQSAVPRIGHGYDVHKFCSDRPLYLGGIQIPHEFGLEGHSDADVALHALIDALLGAAGRGDIGQWFPDNDPQFKGVRSTRLLQRVWHSLTQDGFALFNADVTIQAQAPKLAGHIPAMRACIAETMNVSLSQINIKATTTEGLGFVGEKRGIAVDAVVLLQVEVG